MTEPTLRAATAGDAPAIARIYNHYVAHTTVTFEEVAVPAAEMAARIGELQGGGMPWLVAEQAGQVRGYAYAGKWKARSAYRFAAESTVYLDPDTLARGLGSRLYAALFDELKARGLHVVIGGIALPNERSVALHEKFGMSKVAHFEQVGFKFGRRIDVAYWQKLL